MQSYLGKYSDILGKLCIFHKKVKNQNSFPLKYKKKNIVIYWNYVKLLSRPWDKSNILRMSFLQSWHLKIIEFMTIKKKYELKELAHAWTVKTPIIAYNIQNGLEALSLFMAMSNGGWQLVDLAWQESFINGDTLSII